jgi:hypothetical protein
VVGFPVVGLTVGLTEDCTTGSVDLVSGYVSRVVAWSVFVGGVAFVVVFGLCVDVRIVVCMSLAAEVKINLV